MNLHFAFDKGVVVFQIEVSRDGMTNLVNISIDKKFDYDKFYDGNYIIESNGWIISNNVPQGRIIKFKNDTLKSTIYFPYYDSTRLYDLFKLISVILKE